MASANLLHRHAHFEMSFAPQIQTEADRAKQQLMEKQRAETLAPIPRIATGEKQTTLRELTEQINQHRRSFRSFTGPSVLETVCTFGAALVRHRLEYAQVNEEQVQAAVMDLVHHGILAVRGDAIILVQQYTYPRTYTFPSAKLTPCSASLKSTLASTELSGEPSY